MPLDILQNRLVNQRLSGTKLNTPNEVVNKLAAVQAQDYAGAKWALGQRLKEVTDLELDQAFADGSILRTHLLRPTWHFVTPEDIRWLLKLTAPRVHKVNGTMYRKVEVGGSVLKKSYRILEKSLQGNRTLTRDEIRSVFEKEGIITDNLRITYFMMSAELDGVICSGPRRGKQFTYALLEERVPPIQEWKREEALAELIRRYISTRGPATLQDFTWWSGLTMADAKNAIEEIKSEFMSEELDGQTYWLPEPKPVKEKSPMAYLLPNYDEYFIGFKDRTAINALAQNAGIKNNDPALVANVIILNGHVVGGWKRTLNKDSVTVETNMIVQPTEPEEKAIRLAAEQLGRFLELPIEFILQESKNAQRKTRSF